MPTFNPLAKAPSELLPALLLLPHARLRLAAGVLLASAAWSSAALAAGADATATATAAAVEDGGSTIDDIVVTATRKETKLQSTPVAVSVIGEEFRRTQNVITARDLAGQVPGLYTSPSGITPLTNTFFHSWYR